jgi:hypothetical protein
VSSERRREVRYPIEVPVTLAAAGVVQTVITKDVSYSGLFARTDRPPRISQLTRIQIELPESGQVFETHAMSVFVLETDNDRDHEAGCGLKFYAMSDVSRRMWNIFVDGVRATNAARAIPPEINTPRTRPRQVRFKTRVALRPESLVELRELYLNQLSTGALKLTIRKPAGVGSPLRVDVVHPTSGAIFKLDGTVTRLVEELPGVEITLDDFDDTRRAEFVDFIGAEPPA